MGLLCNYIGFSHLCTFAPSKITFAAVFFIMYVYVCEYLIYRKTPKSVLFAVCSRFPSYMYVCTIFRFWYVCIRLFLFSFSLAFCFTKIMCETLRKFLYVYARLICIFMQDIMINRKLFGNFRLFHPFVANVLSFYFSFSRFYSYFGYISENENRNEKAAFLLFLLENVPFCRKQNADFQ